MQRSAIFAFVLVSLFTMPARAQSILLSEDFDSYDGHVSNIPAGFTITWNDTSAGSKSFYTSSGYCGVTCNSYKFGVDSASIITAPFSNPGSVSFYLKGNGLYVPNRFRVYESPNGSGWTLVSAIDSISASAQTVTLPLDPGTTQLKFVYLKDVLGYNAGFDDLVVYGPVGLGESASLEGVGVFPSPARDFMTIDFGTDVFGRVSVQLVNILGRDVYRDELPAFTGRYVFDVSDFPDGMYLLHLKAGYREIVKRVIVKK